MSSGTDAANGPQDIVNVQNQSKLTQERTIAKCILCHIPAHVRAHRFLTDQKRFCDVSSGWHHKLSGFRIRRRASTKQKPFGPFASVRSMCRSSLLFDLFIRVSRNLSAPPEFDDPKTVDQVRKQPTGTLAAGSSRRYVWAGHSPQVKPSRPPEPEVRLGGVQESTANWVHTKITVSRKTSVWVFKCVFRVVLWKRK